jgi:hypothetical protein
MISADTRWLQQARSHLRAADPVLARLIDDRPDFADAPPDTPLQERLTTTATTSPKGRPR